MTWRELPLTRATLQERGLRIHGVWTDHVGLSTPPCVFVHWQDDPNRHEMAIANYFIVAHKVYNVLPGNERPWE